MIRLDFSGFSGEESLDPICWEEWFEKFEERKLAMIFPEETADGDRRNLSKLVSRDVAKGRGLEKVASRPTPHRRMGQ